MTAATPQRRILVIDDDPDVLKAYDMVLGEEAETGSASEAMGRLLGGDAAEDREPEFILSFARQGEEGFNMAVAAADRGEPYALAFVDVRMPPGWDGMETAVRLRASDPRLELVIVTAYSDRSREEIVRAVGSSAGLLFFRKPFDPEELKQLALSLSDKWLLARQAEEQRQELLASEQRFRALVETTSDWVWEVDREGRLTYCSPVCRELYGHEPEDLLGKTFFEVLSEPGERDHFRQIFASCVASASRCQSVERRCLTKTGRLIFVESSGAPVLDPMGQVAGFRGIDRDITARKQAEEERRRLEEQYRQSQKLEALGTLAGGIAHDLNNILTPIIGYCGLGQAKTDQDHPLRQYFDAIANCGQRAADLIRRILAFCRKQEMVVQRVDLNELVRELTKMLRRLIREDISLSLALTETVWPVLADRTQLEQVLLNLVVNARDAMGEGGALVIATENRSVAPHTQYDVDAQEVTGDFVVLSVRDQGQGIEPEKVRMIFDPFFTTKETGKGTGLGLATVHGIVAQHGGHVVVESELGHGSCFTVFLPRNEQQAGEAGGGAPSVDIHQGSGVVLLVEDDETVLNILRETLEEAGYSVLTATNGQDGMAVYERELRRIDLLITDLIMPGMGGRALGQAIRERAPGLPILYMSGYSFEVSSQELIRDQPNTAMMQKPFPLPQFTRAVRGLIESARRG
ncbi:MAG: response regulator [Thermodesulfobacteriota bacterium]